MANMSVSQADFEALADAALSAEARGDMAEAVALDKLARKVSAALTVASSKGSRHIVRMATGKEPSPFTWESVPSLLGMAARASGRLPATPPSDKPLDSTG